MQISVIGKHGTAPQALMDADAVTARPLMRWRRATLAAALVVVLVSVGYTQTPAEPGRAPDFSVQVWGYIAADFTMRVDTYFEVRQGLEVGLPPLIVTDDPADIRTAERALARRIREALEGARQGEIFTREISEAFRSVLLSEMDAPTRAAIMEDNPGWFAHRIHGTYPKEHPMSTVPPNILALLPRLPDDIQYRFLGPHLVLHDIRANVILDRIACAIPCLAQP